MFVLFLEMRGLCGIRRLGVQEGLDSFLSAINRFLFLLNFLFIFFQSYIISSDNLIQYFVSFVQDAQSAINDLSGKDGVVLLRICSSIIIFNSNYHT